MKLMFDSETGELNPSTSKGLILCVFQNCVPYYNLEGKYAGYCFGSYGIGYYHPKYGYVASYEELDW